jgi:cytochrome subunit of sulfide dehydrogenase
MRTPRFIALAITAGLFIFGVGCGMATAENSRGAESAAMCAACHRLDSRDKAIPPIVGIGKAELVSAMAAYKSGARSSSIMHAVALSLSDAEIAKLAEYLAAQSKENKRQ